MSIIVINAHTGEQHAATSTAQSSQDSFKSWLSSETSVAPSNQILLTSSGKQAKLQQLLSDSSFTSQRANSDLATSNRQELFLYDRQLISSSNTNSPKRPSLLRKTSISTAVSTPPPDLPTSSHDDIHAWKRLLQVRRDWAQRLQENSKRIAGEVIHYSDAAVNVKDGLTVAVGNLQSHVRTLHGRYGEARKWATTTSKEHDDVVQAVEVAEAQMQHLPANAAFARFLPRLELASKQTSSNPGTSSMLIGFAPVDRLDAAITTLQVAQQSVTDRVDTLEKSMAQVNQDQDELVAAAEDIQRRSLEDTVKNTQELLDEIAVLAKKLNSDCEHAASLQSNPKSVAQLSRIASLQAKQYIPTVKEYHNELCSDLEQAREHHSQTADDSLSTMQGIAKIEASFATINKQLTSLDLPEDAESAFDLLTLVAQLPFVYGALLVEAVRRREWSSRIRAESSELAEDIAGYREEEEKRRKRWLKNMGHLIETEEASEKVLNFELNLQADGQDWPEVSRDDISAYLRALRELDGMDEIVEELSESAKDLDRPTKRQVRKAKNALESGNEQSANMQGSFLITDRQDGQVLRDHNARLEEELQGQKSRVRKLEEILYQQQRRPSSANIFEASAEQRMSGTSLFDEPGSPRSQHTLSRKASRQRSASKSGEERPLAQRVVALEAELQDQKQKLREERRLRQEDAQTREEEAEARADNERNVETEIQEAQSTKRDLMENMEAQQREFGDERRLLQDQVKDLQLQIEELEEQIDHMFGSRENERTAAEDKLRQVEVKLDETQKQLNSSESEQEARKEAEQEQVAALHTIRSSLGAQTSASYTVSELLHELEELAQRSTRKAEEFQQKLSSTKADREALQATLDRQEKEFESYKDQIRASEEEATSLRSDLDAERATSISISGDLEDARTQLKSLRSKMANGETGSEALRSRLEDQAARASKLSTELAQSKSHVNSLDFELSSLQRRHMKLQEESSLTSKRLEHRSGRDKELTQMLANVQDELLRLLDALGLSVFYRDGALAIQRTSKLANASISGLDESVQLHIPSTVDLRPEASLMQWMQAESGDEEAALYGQLRDKITTLDLSIFSEAVIKVRRDVEWTGRKWKSEAKGYRDKYHRIQSESHDKLAFRSFKEGDLALFLPTRNQAKRSWAAFNVGAPHYFLREQDSHRLQNREWLVARITKISERVVDLSRSAMKRKEAERDAASLKSATGESAMSIDEEEENPFELSDGLTWYLLEATEERPGAPLTPSLGKSTVASANVDAKGSVRARRSPKETKDHDLSKMLNKSLDTGRSRRSSTSSKRASISAIPEETAQALQDASAARARLGSRSSATAPSFEPLSGLAVSPGQDRKPPQQQAIEAQSKVNPTPSRAQEALNAASASSPSKAPFLGIFGTSASPPKTSWFNRSPSRTRATATSAAETSPPKKHQQDQARPLLDSRTRSFEFAKQPLPSPSKSTSSPLRKANGTRSPSAASSPSKRPQQAQSQPPKPTAWQSLWDVNVSFEEDKSRATNG